MTGTLDFDGEYWMNISHAAEGYTYSSTYYGHPLDCLFQFYRELVLSATQQGLTLPRNSLTFDVYVDELQLQRTYMFRRRDRDTRAYISLWEDGDFELTSLGALE